jgi:hypothetical protein
MSIRLFLLAATLVVAVQAAGGGRITGHLVDPAGASVNGSVRLRVQSSHVLVTRFTTLQNGTFESAILPAGSYTLTAWAQGFNAHSLTVQVRDGETTELGEIELGVSGCDDPGVICDDFGLRPPDPVVKSGYLELRLGCGVDLRESKSYCGKSPGSAAHIDLQLRKTDSGLSMNSSTGARFYWNCGGTSRPAIPIDGLGPGDTSCVQTGGGLSSHIFFVDDVEPDSESIRFWHVTRKR